MAEPWQVNNLVLLIGTNPLPNFVVARYLIDQARQKKLAAPQIHYIVTSNTKDIPGRIHKALGLTSPLNVITLSDPYSPELVCSDLGNMFLGLRGSVHINYTGGTKVMSVEAVVCAIDKLQTRLTRSYLDPNTFHLRTSDGHFYPIDGDLRNLVQPSLKQILELHACELLEDSEPAWPETAAAMVPFILTLSSSNAMKAYRDWLDNLLYGLPERTNTRKQFSDACGNWADRMSETVTWHTEPTFNSVVDALRVADSQIVNSPPRQWRPNRDRVATRFIHFFRGGWLEECISKAAAEAGVWNIAKVNVGARHIGASEHRDMELDVIALRGYSFTLFSCTTGIQVKDIKLKAFEAIHRAQQLGGDEARAIVACLTRKNELRQLWQDLASDHGGRLPLRFISWEGLRNLNDTIMGIAEGRRNSSGEEERVF